LSFKNCRWLFSVVTLIETFDATGGIDYSALTRKERMAGAAKLDSHFLLGRTECNNIAAGAYDLGI
jgi:hypothetical protein